MHSNGSLRIPFNFFLLIIILLTELYTYAADAPVKAVFRKIPLKSKITKVQPMTGIVLWESLNGKTTEAIQLEYSYMRYSDVVKEKGVYDWAAVEKKLNSVASRSHQAVMRFWDTYPGQPSSVPDYIKALPGYNNIVEKSENRDTGFPDWSNEEYQRFFLEFYKKFAEKYDRDPRLAFLQVGFGLWSEYHIYDPKEIIGKNFPSKSFQASFFNVMSKSFQETPWLISQDAQLDSRSPFANQPDLLKLKFGIFDDSFHLAWKPGYNYNGWKFFGLNRYQQSPAGGEILFPDKAHSNFVSSQWPIQTRSFGISFMVCEQWLKWISLEQLRMHSMACGYKFSIKDFETDGKTVKVTVENTGVAPIYYDAFITVDGVRANASLKALQPGQTYTYDIKSDSKTPAITIECDRLVKGQEIQFDADLS